MNYSNEIWITSEKRKRKATTGTPSDPHSVTTRDGFDGITAKAILTGKSLHLHPGVYFTRGSWGEAAKNAGRLKLHGPGEDVCSLELQTTFEEQPFGTYNGKQIRRPDVGILWVRQRPGSAPSIIEGIALRASHITDPRLLITTGINSEGSVTVRNVSVDGIRGLWAFHPETGLQYEAFGIRSIGGFGGTLIEDCVVDHEANSYGNGITLGHLPGSNPTPSVIQRCNVIGGVMNHCGYTASAETAIRDCISSGTIHGVYQDTGPMRNVSVRNCRHFVHWAAFRLHSHTESESRLGFSVRDTVVTFELQGNNRDSIMLALTHTDTPAMFDGIYVEARATNGPGTYYAISASLPEARLNYGLRLTGPSGKTNLPGFITKAKAKREACVANMGWKRGEIPSI